MNAVNEGRAFSIRVLTDMNETSMKCKYICMSEQVSRFKSVHMGIRVMPACTNMPTKSK